MQKVDTWEELLDALMTVKSEQSDDTGWRIYRYLMTHYKEMSSAEARTLLNCYMKLPCTRPSLLHSCILSVAMKMKEQFPDFRFVAFVNLWNQGNVNGCLRQEDWQTSTGKDGKAYPALVEKLVHIYAHELLVKPEDKIQEPLHGDLALMAKKLGYIGIKRMVAIKMFESEREGKKVRTVKLIAANGMELIADWHLFHCKPWEICGNMYEVQVRQSKQNGTSRVADVVLSKKNIADEFPMVIGYIDRYDAKHNHYHIFDALSRHFVAEAPKQKLQQGQYVWFCPVIPAVDKFKSAVVISIENQQKGREAFGIHTATVTSVNTQKEYFVYSLDGVAHDPSKPVDEQIEPTGITFFNETTIRPQVGDKYQVIVFLRRCADKKKRNHVAEFI